MFAFCSFWRIFDRPMNISLSTSINYISPYIVNRCLRLPFYSSRVQAGFASPADDFIEQYLDLNELLVEHEQATYFVRVAGRSMIDAGIYPDDILIVDRSLEAKHNKIIIAVIDGEVTVKRLQIRGDKVVLKAENKDYKDIHVTGELNTWGVVTSIIHRV